METAIIAIVSVTFITTILMAFVMGIVVFKMFRNDQILRELKDNLEMAKRELEISNKVSTNGIDSIKKHVELVDAAYGKLDDKIETIQLKINGQKISELRKF